MANIRNNLLLEKQMSKTALLSIFIVLHYIGHSLIDYNIEESTWWIIGNILQLVSLYFLCIVLYKFIAHYVPIYYRIMQYKWYKNMTVRNRILIYLHKILMMSTISINDKDKKWSISVGISGLHEDSVHKINNAINSAIKKESKK